MPNYDPVIDKLIEKSEAGAVPWKPTYDDNTFILALEGEISFEISRLGDGGFTFTMKDKEGKKIIDLTSHRRERFRDIDYVDDDSYYQKVYRLFEGARVTALEVDKKLNVAESLLDKF